MNQYIQDRLLEKKLYSKGMITLENAKKALEYSINRYFDDETIKNFHVALTNDCLPEELNKIKNTGSIATNSISNNYKSAITELIHPDRAKDKKFILISNPIYNNANVREAGKSYIRQRTLEITVVECGKQFQNVYAKAKILGNIAIEEKDTFVIIENNERFIVYTSKKLELGQGFEFASVLPDKVIFENGIEADKQELGQILKANRYLADAKTIEMFEKAQELLNRVSGKNEECRQYKLSISLKAIYNTVVKNNLLYSGKDSNKTIDDMLNEIFIETQFKRIKRNAIKYYNKMKVPIKKIQFTFILGLMNFDIRLTPTNCFINLGVLTLDKQGVDENKYIKGSSINKLIDKTIQWFKEQGVNLDVDIKFRVLDQRWGRNELSSYVEKYKDIKSLIEVAEFDQQPDFERTLYIKNRSMY